MPQRLRVRMVVYSQLAPIELFTVVCPAGQLIEGARWEPLGTLVGFQVGTARRSGALGLLNEPQSHHLALRFVPCVNLFRSVMSFLLRRYAKQLERRSSREVHFGMG
mmetsp:Transcript_45319/g.67319  ORF Transcript_45319/g.67319 Transcript_45319/m.67319 type:complete len:107 (+) Transcript_45319:1039-1359(+)